MLEKDTNEEQNNDINTSSSGFILFNSSESFDEQIDQDQVEVLLQDLKAETISASSILSSSNITLSEKDRINLI